MKYMKRILVITLLLFVFGHKSVNAQSNQKALHVQICLNDMYKEFKYFGKSSMILVKNEYSKGLENLHYGKKRFSLKDVPTSERYITLDESEQKGVIYTTILGYKADSKTAEVIIHIPNGINAVNLIKTKHGWKIKDGSFSLDEPNMEEPTATSKK